MKRFFGHRIRLLLSALMLAAGLALLAPAAQAQAVTTITANPNAQRLHEIWRLRGAAEQDRVGNAAGTAGDINGDSIDDFAVHRGGISQWQVFYGSSDSLSASPRWTFDLANPMPHSTVVGDFWGTGHKALAFGQDRFWDKPSRYWMYIFGTDSNRLSDSASAVLDPYTTMAQMRIFPSDAKAVDLDGDGADELILAIPKLISSQGGSDYPEIWIYKGGPNFQVDAPTVVIRDSERIGGDERFTLAAADFDHDGFPDLITFADYYVHSSPSYLAVSRLKFYFSQTGTLPSMPSRIISLDTAHYPSIDFDLPVLDLDADGAADIILTGTAGRSYIYRTHHTWKSARSRPFTFDDADIVLAKPGFSMPAAIGCLNDSAGRFPMFALFGNLGGKATMLAFSGGPDGPDGTYDAVYDNDLASPFAYVWPCGDVNGDGWPDLLCNDPSWYSMTLNFGIATIVSGGPYIPRDSATSSVRDVTLENHSNALSLWPMPMHEVLNIAWRGDLRHMPHRFEVHDMDGRLIAGGAIDAMAGSALWRCADAPAGAYLLSVMDRHGSLLAAQRIIKQ